MRIELVCTIRCRLCIVDFRGGDELKNKNLKPTLY